jgi:tetratricopeptide (TPR) repeat protein
MDTARRQYHLRMAVGFLEGGLWQRAEAECGNLLAEASEDHDAMLLQGLASSAQGKADHAAPLLNRVAREWPQKPHPCNDLASLRPSVPCPVIIAQFRACLDLSPGDTRLRQSFAGFLIDHGQPADALKLLAETPDSAACGVLRGHALSELSRFTEAAAAFSDAVRTDPALASGWANLGMVLKIEGHYDDALAAYDRALALRPDDVQIRVNRTVALLHAGRWREAWPDYEQRLRLPGYAGLPLDRLLPCLSQRRDWTGKTIAVVHEEGYGDTLQFLRYVPLLAGLGATVVLVVPPPLQRLVRGMSGVTEVRTSLHTLSSYDFHCPFFSLPRAFESTPDQVPHDPYLRAPPELISAWRDRLPDDGLRVGLVWAGQSRPWLAGFMTLDQRRSATLAAFAPLAALPGVRFISLQAGPQSVRAQPPPVAMNLHDPMDGVTDFADTAALIHHLDVVVSVDTSVLHLAAGMGKPVLLLDRYDNCWRWLHGRSDSPWYPNLTIFRQRRPGDWSEPMRQIAHRLSQMSASLGAGAYAPPDIKRVETVQ